MSDLQARVVHGASGETSLYLFSEAKMDGGASTRFACLSCEQGAIRAVLHLEERGTPGISSITSVKLRPDTFPGLLDQMASFVEER